MNQVGGDIGVIHKTVIHHFLKIDEVLKCGVGAPIKLRVTQVSVRTPRRNEGSEWTCGLTLGDLPVAMPSIERGE